MGKFKTEDETRKDTISPLKVSFNFVCKKRRRQFLRHKGMKTEAGLTDPPFWWKMELDNARLAIHFLRWIYRVQRNIYSKKYLRIWPRTYNLNSADQTLESKEKGWLWKEHSLITLQPKLRFLNFSSSISTFISLNKIGSFSNIKIFTTCLNFEYFKVVSSTTVYEKSFNIFLWEIT